jgi:hypothetical protein
MISNERQYRITKAAAGSSTGSKELDKNGGLQEGIIRALFRRSACCAKPADDLLEEIDEYERLKAGNVPVIEIESPTTCRMA